jgi:hypothetical protein
MDKIEANEIIIVTPIMRKLMDEVLNNTIDNTTSDPDDDSPFERTLCAAWDVCTVPEYALAMNTSQFHRLLLKVHFLSHYYYYYPTPTHPHPHPHTHTQYIFI